jgi:hypothetical protein
MAKIGAITSLVLNRKPFPNSAFPTKAQGPLKASDAWPLTVAWPLKVASSSWLRFMSRLTPGKPASPTSFLRFVSAPLPGGERAYLGSDRWVVLDLRDFGGDLELTGAVVAEEPVFGGHSVLGPVLKATDVEMVDAEVDIAATGMSGTVHFRYPPPGTVSPICTLSDFVFDFESGVV